MKRFALLLFVLTACANPKYAPASTMQVNGAEGGPLTCQAKFVSGVCVDLRWVKLPTEEDFGSFRFTTFREGANGAEPTLEDVSDLNVILWMPSMGHGSSPVALLRESLGVYEASNVFFTMRGDWEIRFQQKTGGKVADQAILPVHF